MNVYKNRIMKLEQLFEDLSGMCGNLPLNTVVSYIVNIPENEMKLSDIDFHYVMEELFLYGATDKSYCPEYLFVEYYNKTHRKLGSELEWSMFRERYIKWHPLLVHRNGERYRGYEGEQFYDINNNLTDSVADNSKSSCC